MVHYQLIILLSFRTQICRSRGITCIICRAPEMLYPFGEHVSVCPQCSLTFHRLAETICIV